MSEKRAVSTFEPFRGPTLKHGYEGFHEMLYENLLRSMVSKACFDELLSYRSEGSPRIGSDLGVAKMAFDDHISGKRVALPIYPLGSYNHEDGGFLWMWYNSQMRDVIPESAYYGMDHCLDYTKEHSITEMFSSDKSTNLVFREGEHIAAMARAITGCPSYASYSSSDKVTIYWLVAELNDELKPDGPINKLLFPIHQLSLFNKSGKWPAGFHKRRLLDGYLRGLPVDVFRHCNLLKLEDEEGSAIRIAFSENGQDILEWKEDLKSIETGSYFTAASFHRMDMTYEMP